MWLILVGLLVVGFLIFTVAKTGSMNADPLQQELAGRMMAALAESKMPQPAGQRWVKREDGTSAFEPPSPKGIIQGWDDVKRWLVEATPNKSPGERRTMVAHAISMMKPHLDEWDYDLFRRFGRVWGGE